MSFNHHLFFSMGKIDCSLPEQDVVDRMQLLIDHAYLGNRVAVVKYFKVIDADNCEFAIERHLPRDFCLALGQDFIGEHDESLLSGLEICYFSFFPGSKITPMVAPLIPMGQAFYTPKERFTQFWKGLNKGHAGEKIQRIRIGQSWCTRHHEYYQYQEYHDNSTFHGFFLSFSIIIIHVSAWVSRGLFNHFDPHAVVRISGST